MTKIRANPKGNHSEVHPNLNRLPSPSKIGTKTFNNYCKLKITTTSLLTLASSPRIWYGTSNSLSRFLMLIFSVVVYTAQTYGRVIISELSVPIQNKTIRPTSIGGAAGGEKYIVNGILFKFALDFNGIYGGDENAAKAAGHDLKVRTSETKPLFCLFRS